MRQYYTLDNEDMKKLNNGEEVELPIEGSLFERIPGLRKIILVKEENFNRDRLHILCEAGRPEPEIYEGDDVLVDLPGHIEEKDGYSSAFCKCGYTLYIKTPKRKGWRAIRCPKCGFCVNLFCGEEDWYL